ncbi:MAG: hypothetical protein K0R75_47, partial [Paenibacillaceae bacterium]|nr:hypothetical protein [Paenibacillaceae bacterium]
MARLTAGALGSDGGAQNFLSRDRDALEKSAAPYW